MRLAAKIFFILSAAFMASTAYAEEVLIITWQGKLPSELSFEKKLKELRPNVKFSYIDAKRKKGNLAQALRSVDLNKVNLVYSFGTTGTKLVKTFLDGKKPLVFNVVSTPVISGIAKSVEKPGGNLTGAKLLIDFKTQINVMTKLKDIKTMALWYDPREKQGEALLTQAVKYAEESGIKVNRTRVIPDAADFDTRIVNAVEEAKKYDVIFILGGSSVHQNARKIFSKIDPSMFVMTNSTYYALQGATVALSADFAERGQVVAEQAHKILGGASAGDIPVSLVTKKNVVLFVNKSRFAQAGLKNLDKLDVKVKYIKQLY